MSKSEDSGADAFPESPHRTIKLSGIAFNVEKSFTPLRLLGHGTYGAVCSASCRGEEAVAIKRIAGVFGARGRVVEAKRTLREVQLLRYLQHENIIRIRHLMLSPDGRDAYIVTDLMQTDLHQIIASPQPLTEEHVAWFIYQLLCGLKYIHSAGVVHRDLKPSNLLVNEECDLRMCDFGMARTVSEDAGGAMSVYVMTRWYRAPEIVLQAESYATAVDLWSASTESSGAPRHGMV